MKNSVHQLPTHAISIEKITCACRKCQDLNSDLMRGKMFSFPAVRYIPTLYRRSLAQRKLVPGINSAFCSCISIDFYALDEPLLELGDQQANCMLPSYVASHSWWKWLYSSALLLCCASALGFLFVVHGHSRFSTAKSSAHYRSCH
jgi:hypothetical protein